MKNEMPFAAARKSGEFHWVEVTNDKQLMKLEESSFRKGRKLEKKRDFFLQASLVTLIALIVIVILSIFPFTNIG